MREIIFRGKRIDSGEWVYGDVLNRINTLSKDKAIVVFDGYVIPKSVKVFNETIGQYTGLKDKNGKEIYEGDIAFHRDYECCGYVVFSGDELAFAFLVITGSNNKGLTTEFEWLYDYADGLEIIGNIHDNPELLEAQHE